MLASQSVKSECDIAHPTHEEVWTYLCLLLGRTEFNASSRNRRFLTYVVEETLGGRAVRIKAYNIALTVLERAEDFNPLIDPIVRIEASRLRRSLEHYYLTAGKTDRIRIDIPKGSYVATFAYNDAVESEAAAEGSVSTANVFQPPIATKRRTWTTRAPVLAALIFLAAGIAAYQSWNGSRGAAAVASANALSIMVLPFENTSGDPGRALVARGITYDLIVRLTQLHDVAVFSSDGRLGGGSENQALPRSNYALFGSVQPEANRIRVTAVLADSRTGQFLQSWHFERDLEKLDYPDLQSDIANRVVLAVRHLCAIDIEPSEDGPKESSDRGVSYDCRRLPYVAAN